MAQTNELALLQEPNGLNDRKHEFSLVKAPHQDFAEYAVQGKKTPTGPLAYKAVGVTLVMRGKYGPALRSLKNVALADPNDSEAFFYMAIALLQGKNPRQASRRMIDRATQCIHTAIAHEWRGIYWHFLAYINFEYFTMQGLSAPTSYVTCLENAEKFGATREERNTLFCLLRQPEPLMFKLI